MKFLKNTFALLLAFILGATAFLSSDFTAHAAGWANSARSIKLNTTYSDALEPGSDFEGNDYYYDAFKFTVPAKGKINIRLEAEDESYFYWNSTEYYIYKSSNLDDYIWYYLDNTVSDGYSSGGGYYYRNMKANLSAGTYYFVVMYRNSSYDGSYDLRLSYTPTFSNTSLKKVTAKKAGFKATWKQSGNATGYQIQYSRKKNMKSSKTAKMSRKTTSKTIGKLKRKKTYYVRIRTYKTLKVNGKNKTYYGKWSGKKSVKTK